MTAAPGLSGRVLLPFVIVTAIWGSTWLAIRYQLGTVDTGWSLCYRFLIGSAAVFAYGLWIGAPLRIGRAGIGPVLLLALTQFFGNYIGTYQAERFVTSGVVAMFFATLVIPNAVLARIFLKQQVTRNFVIGSLIAFVGMALLFEHELRHPAGDSEQAALGIALAIGGMLSASLGNVMQGAGRVRDINPVALFAWSMAFGALFNGLSGLVAAGPPTIDLRAPYLLSMLYLGLFGSAVTFPLYYFVIGHIGPARAAYSGVISPIIAMLLSTLFEGYRWSPAAIAGSALALAGLVIALRARSPAR
jgi:drug/metabolite transporter (DMT)-like permease